MSKSINDVFTENLSLISRSGNTFQRRQMFKRKQLLINEKDFKDLKKIWRGGLFARCSDSLFIRELIEHELKEENKK